MRKGRKCVRGDRRESDVIRYFRAEIFFRAPIKIFRNFSLWNFPSFVKVAEIEITISYETFLRCNDNSGIQNKENRERERERRRKFTTCKYIYNTLHCIY